MLGITDNAVWKRAKKEYKNGKIFVWAIIFPKLICAMTSLYLELLTKYPRFQTIYLIYTTLKGTEIVIGRLQLQEEFILFMVLDYAQLT